MNLNDVVNAIKSRSSGQKPILIAIEGFGGSGKSTIASKLAELLGDTDVVSIDDFIIKENLTKDDWDKQVFDRDRLEREVLLPASKSEIVSYRKLLWDTNTLSEPIQLLDVHYLIVEGISSYHPSIAHYYDYRIWVDTPIEVAKSRGKQRDAGNENEQYWDMWADNDLAYQEKYHPELQADFVLKSGTQSIQDLEQAFRMSWSPRTNNGPVELLNEGEPSAGQCAVATLVVQDYFGGEILNTIATDPEYPNLSSSHYFNIIDGQEVDLTRQQFKSTVQFTKPQAKTKGFDSAREYMLSYPETFERYRILKERVRKYLEK